MGVGYQDLKIWKKAKDLAVLIYKITDTGKIVTEFGLRDQMRRSSVSIASNIAEGDERKSDKEAVRFFYIAKGSTAELRTQNTIAYEVGFLSEENYRKIDMECLELGKMIGGLIKHRTYSL